MAKNITDNRRQRRTTKPPTLEEPEPREKFPGTGRVSPKLGLGGGHFTIGQAAKIIQHGAHAITTAPLHSTGRRACIVASSAAAPANEKALPRLPDRGARKETDGK